MYTKRLFILLVLCIAASNMVVVADKLTSCEIECKNQFDSCLPERNNDRVCSNNFCDCMIFECPWSKGINLYCFALLVYKLDNQVYAVTIIMGLKLSVAFLYMLQSIYLEMFDSMIVLINGTLFCKVAGRYQPNIKLRNNHFASN